MTVFHQIDEYHTTLIHQLAKTSQHLDNDASVTLYSGAQQIKVQAVLIRNASKFLGEIVPSPCSCSCSETSIILPHTPSPALASFVKLLHYGILPRVSNVVAEAITAIAKVLGVKNINRTEKDVSKVDDDDEDTFVNIDDHKSSEDIARSSIKINAVLEFSDKSMILNFPKCRLERKSNPNLSEYYQPDTFKGRIQEEYNLHPVGQFMGPYDQNEQLNLNAQLPNSNFDFENYTKFFHDGNKCFEYKIENYEKFDILDKISSYKITSEAECTEKGIDDDIDIFYTCQHKMCRIPCPCAQCCSDIAQCGEHKLCHPALFNEQEHALSIRSSYPFCESNVFFENSYIIKYPGIPIKCESCRKDLLNHHSYHFEYHEKCRFCCPTFFKKKATTKKELDSLIKDEEEYYKTVCQYCNRRFCQEYYAKRHIKSEHGEKPFKCEKCGKQFQSSIAKSHHEETIHSVSLELVGCNVCGKQFKSKVHLKQHNRYVHSDTRKWSCDECDAKFKQKRDFRLHMLKKHDVNYLKEDYDEKKINSDEEYKCKICKVTFSYMKNLNAHIKSQHTFTEEMFQCDECESIFTKKRNLAAHKRLKHEQGVKEFSCSFCGKSFREKPKLRRHEKLHVDEQDVDA